MSVIVWWTIPGSAVAMEWRPDKGVCITSSRDYDVFFDAYLIPAATWQWGPPDAAPTGQHLADLAATFAMEANVKPSDMTITWIDEETYVAVSWDRQADKWQLHDVRYRHGHPYVASKGVLLISAPKGCDINDSGDVALGYLRPYKKGRHVRRR